MKVKILVPETLAEITLEQYQKFLKISKDNEDSLFLQQKMVSIFCNIEMSTVLATRYSSIKEITEHLNEIFKIKPKFISSFKRGNLEFGFIPNLDDMTFGEYVDIDSTLNDWESIHKAIGVLFRPITLKQSNKYLIEKYETYDKYDMQKTPLDVVFGSLIFFWNLSSELVNHIPIYLKEELQNLTLQQKQILQDDGIGTQAFIDSLQEMLPTLTKLPDYPYTNA
jgi:hypothetical protein